MAHSMNNIKRLGMLNRADRLVRCVQVNVVFAVLVMQAEHTIELLSRELQSKQLDCDRLERT